MELLVAAFVVVGLIVVAGRFLFRSKSGEIVLPAMLDKDRTACGRCRRVTGLRLWEREEPENDEVAGSAGVPPASTAVPGWSGAPASTVVAWPDADPGPRAVGQLAARPPRRRRQASDRPSADPADPADSIGGHWPNRLAALLADRRPSSMIALTRVAA